MNANKILKFSQIIIACIILISCNNSKNQTPKNTIETAPILNGQYEVNFEFEQTKEHIWIFKDEFMFMISPKSETEVDYQIPVRYFVENNELYVCGIRGIFDPMTISECKGLNPRPDFEIIQIDTVASTSWKEDIYQRIQLRNMMGSNEIVTIKKILPR
ncbi:hypothetical protein [Kordia sp. SMS9]|uniref:hypothetical protein n=1 Tax=Kordia sp. SMS9 TaxID=2282170 RepID=UPI0013B3E556|nr:hypothetical protein [Kordia sp. SMS9]